MVSMSRRRWWIALWLLLGLVLVVRTGIRDRGVITDHLEFGRRVLAGADLYAPYLEPKPLHPPYPPGFGLLTAPFSLLPERVARFAWGLLQVAALGAIGAWLRRQLAAVAPERAAARADPVLLLTALLASRYILRDTHGGGGNLINLAMVLWSLELAQRRKTVAAGLLLGFSLATKPTQVLMVPLVWLLGSGRAALLAVASAAGFTGLALLSLRHGLAPLERWMEGSLAYGAMNDLYVEPAYGFPPFTWMNQCLRCAVSRYLGTVPPEYAAQVPGFFQGLGLAAPVVGWIGRALSLLALGVTAVGCVRWRAAGAWVVSAVLALSLLLSPISWKAHHVALIPAFCFLLARGLSGRRGLLWALVAYALLCLAGEELTGKAMKEVQQSLYVVTAGTIAVWGLCLREARRDAGVARGVLAPEPARQGQPGGGS